MRIVLLVVCALAAGCKPKPKPAAAPPVEEVKPPRLMAPPPTP